MIFNKQTLRDIVWDDAEGYEKISEDLVDSSRWSLYYEMIFKDLNSGKFYSTSYSTGATECQDESPYEDDPDEIEVTEVVPTEVTVIKYLPKKD